MALIDLPLLMKDAVRGKRSAVTCQLKCASQCAFGECNHSDNPTFRDIASRALSRRTMLGGSTAAVAIGLAGTQGAFAAGGAAPAAPVGPAPALAPNGTALDFEAIAPVAADVDEFTVPEGFEWHTVIRWGDPLFDDAPEFDWNAQSAEAQKLQFGYNNDYTEIQEIPGSDGKRAVMFVNHEYTNENIMLPADTDADDAIEIGMAAHGLTVVELERKDAVSPYTYVKSAELNRRILLTDEFELTGPAAGDDLVKTVEDPEGRTVLGTLGNCAGGLTPWGTLLSGEENFHGYFRSAGTSEAEQRYGLRDSATARGWEGKYDRYDARIEGYENEPNRFGYIVEVDPFDPTSTPRKHTSLGRFKHEGANVIVAADGRVVAYSGDDEVFDYLYKFVSRDTYEEGNKKHNMTLLENGDLYVAKFTGKSPADEIDGSGKVPSDGSFDGTGEWLPLVVDGESKVEGFTVAEVLVHTRLAADKVGPTKMDRCEDVEPSLHTGRVYVACTNNSGRGTEGKAGVDEVNPRTENRDGHVVEIDEGDDQTSTEFSWNLLMVCGDPAQGDQTYFSGFPVDQVSPISCPDNLAFDSVGNLWISTDGAPSGIGYNDGLFRVTLDGEARGRVEQFLSVPMDGETCGPIIRDQDKTAFVSVQHPGEDGEWGAHTSYFPDFDGQGPKPSVIQVLPVKPENPFTDVKKGQEHYDAIIWAYENGIAKGYKDDTFRPLQPVNRDAMAAFLYRLAGSPEVDLPRSEPFKDVKKGQEHYTEIIWAYQMGITTGWSDRTFRPTQPIARDAMAAFVYRYAGSPEIAEPTTAPFTDVKPSMMYAKEIAWLKERGVSKGWSDGTYRPLNPMNRDATTAFLQRMATESNVAFRAG
ncbi:alkaline phosphatase PhoX [Brachybacterium sp. J153]|uniref:alkaline phosphatase PhoX n=1 Tax=Brachybacterium sp. J153 TaxID=3116488 RepID=UPI002E77CF29|nr:alkaline phosphatase PhoX [Brachybacterium sp. J153]MEE1618415.1 alkaline phosphatase PhoX [Brachybacterium sp. J153]